MRYAEVSIRPNARGFHPADGQFVDDEAVERIAIHHINQLNDGSVVLLYELSGTPSRVRTILRSHEDVLKFSVSPIGSVDSSRDSTIGSADPPPTSTCSETSARALHAYAHVNPNELVQSLFTLPQEFSLVIDTPIDCVRDGGIRVRVLGDQSTIATALECLPTAVTTELLGTGRYRPKGRHVTAHLTPRQRDILAVAIDQGYYEVPRATTHEALASELSLSAGTVGEHLRKIESTVLNEVMGS